MMQEHLCAPKRLQARRGLFSEQTLNVYVGEGRLPSFVTHAEREHTFTNPRPPG